MDKNRNYAASCLTYPLNDDKVMRMKIYIVCEKEKPQTKYEVENDIIFCFVLLLIIAIPVSLALVTNYYFHEKPQIEQHEAFMKSFNQSLTPH